MLTQHFNFPQLKSLKSASKLFPFNHYLSINVEFTNIKKIKPLLIKDDKLLSLVFIETFNTLLLS